MGEVKQATFRLDKDVTDKFKAFCEENHFTANQGFSNMMQALELDNAKQIIPDRQTEIEHFQSLTVSLISAFINSLEINTNAENRIRQEFSTRCDADAETITALQKENKKMSEDLEQIKKSSLEQIDKFKNEAISKEENLLIIKKELEQVKQQLEDKIQEIHILRESNSLLDKALASEKDKTQSLKLKISNESDYKQLFTKSEKELQESKKKHEELINEMSLKQLKDISRLQGELQNANAQIELVKIKAESEKANAILSETYKLREKIESLMQEHQKQMQNQISQPIHDSEPHEKK